MDLGHGPGPAAGVSEGSESEEHTADDDSVCGTEPDEEPKDTDLPVVKETAKEVTVERVLATPSREEKAALRLQRLAELRAEMDKLMAASSRNQPSW